jgi:hypothetical protein
MVTVNELMNDRLALNELKLDAAFNAQVSRGATEGATAIDAGGNSGQFDHCHSRK